MLVAFDQITQSVESLNQDALLSSLPFVIIDHEEFWQVIPVKTTGIYFLTHPVEGLLYIGKAKNIRNRWSDTFMGIHDCLEGAVRLGNVRLSWLPLPDGLNLLVEQKLIRLWKPKWNGHAEKGVERRRRAEEPIGPDEFKGIWRK